MVRAERPDDFPDDKEFEQYYVLEDNPELGGKDIKNPEQNFDPRRTSPIVTFDFTDKGRKALPGRSRAAWPSAARPTRSRASRPRAPSRPSPSCSTARSSRGRSSTSTRTRTASTAAPAPRSRAASPLQAAQDLAEFLKIGALPIDLKLISQTQVSATLGKQALRQGLLAAIVGFVLVLLFLLVLYRLLGVVAGLALSCYAASSSR